MKKKCLKRLYGSWHMLEVAMPFLSPKSSWYLSSLLLSKATSIAASILVKVIGCELTSTFPCGLQEERQFVF